MRHIGNGLPKKPTSNSSDKYKNLNLLSNMSAQSSIDMLGKKGSSNDQLTKLLNTFNRAPTIGDIIGPINSSGQLQSSFSLHPKNSVKAAFNNNSGSNTLTEK